MSATETARRWRLVSVDTGSDLRLEGQFPAGEISDDQSAGFGRPAASGASRPLVISVSNGIRVVRLRSEFRSLDYSDDITSRIAQLRALRPMDATLGRHPRVRLEAPGVELVGKVTGAPLTIGPAWVTGLPRYVLFELTVEEDQPLELETTDTAQRETVYVTQRDGETFEHLAARIYGDPRRGDLIRRENPEQAIVWEFARPLPEGPVRVLEPEHPNARQAVSPASVALGALGRGEGMEARLRSLARARGRVGAGLPWASLPEVIVAGGGDL